LADHHNGLASSSCRYSVKSAPNVASRVGDIEEIGSILSLGPARILAVGQLNGRRPHVSSLKFLSEFKD
jgi:hypothetical protein